MATNANTRATIIPSIRYADAPAAIEWLCKAFGFEKHMVVPVEQGGIAHAQLVFGNGMLMLGSARDDEFGQLQKPGGESGGTTRAAVAQSLYIIVEDPDAHYARAKEAGAEIAMELEEQHYGGQLYACRDPEGNLWNFGSYDPWEEGSSAE